jgi:hypothetical protein
MAKRVSTKKRLERLGICQRLFHKFLCGIGIDTAYEQRMKKKSATRFRYIVDRGRGWYSAEEYWALSNAQIARHLGFIELNSPRVTEFYGIRAPEFLPVTWVDFDIDNANHDFQDERLFKILEIFGDDPCLVQYREESGNFSVLLRCIPLFLDKHQQVFGEILQCVGLEVKDGLVEIYPHVERARRLPFGDHQVFRGGCYRRILDDDWIPQASQKLRAFDALKQHWCVNPYQVLKRLTGNRRLAQSR